MKIKHNLGLLLVSLLVQSCLVDPGQPNKEETTYSGDCILVDPDSQDMFQETHPYKKQKRGNEGTDDINGKGIKKRRTDIQNLINHENNFPRKGSPLSGHDTNPPITSFFVFSNGDKNLPTNATQVPLVEYNRGMIYLGDFEHQEKAISCLTTAANGGHAGAQYELGKLYVENKQSITKPKQIPNQNQNEKEAFKWL
jgi:TPR repeat protein